MWPIDTIGVFLHLTGCTDKGRTLLSVTYLEYSLTVFFFAATSASMYFSENNLSAQLYGLLCLLIESFLLLCLPLRLYHRSEFREMNERSREIEISRECRLSIDFITKYHLTASNFFVIASAFYVIAFDSVRMGDPFTFPFVDFLPVKTDGVAVYACKYALYALPVYIAHLEICFINTTFIHSVGVLKRRCKTLVEQIDEAFSTNDKQKLNDAVVQHQELIAYFKTMKLVYAKPILLTIAFCAIYFGLTTCFVIQALQGYIHQIILGICITSGMAALISIIIYCIYANNVCDLHNEVLQTLFDQQLYSVDKSFKRSSLIMMTRTAIPLTFEIGFIFKTDLKLLVKIIKFSYTVLNVLLASIKPHDSI